jgi:hypothetical protein
MVKDSKILEFEQKYCQQQGREPDENGYMSCSTPPPRCKYLTEDHWCSEWNKFLEEERKNGD